MSENNLKDESVKPHKRIGVWTSDTVKQKGPEDILKRYSRTGIARTSSIEDEDDISVQAEKKSAFNDLKTDLFKLPGLKSWSEINIGLLLKQFNKQEEVKEDDVPWSEDFLFAEITNKLSKDETNT